MVILAEPKVLDHKPFYKHALFQVHGPEALVTEQKPEDLRTQLQDLLLACEEKADEWDAWRYPAETSKRVFTPWFGRFSFVDQEGNEQTTESRLHVRIPNDWNRQGSIRTERRLVEMPGGVEENVFEGFKLVWDAATRRHEPARKIAPSPVPDVTIIEMVDDVAICRAVRPDGDIIYWDVMASIIQQARMALVSTDGILS